MNTINDIQANEKDVEDHKKTTEEKVSEQKSQDSEKVRISAFCKQR